MLRRSGRAGEGLAGSAGTIETIWHLAGAGHLVGDGDGIVLVNQSAWDWNSLMRT